MNKRIKELYDESVNVLKDCCLENGAIVASNSDKPYYPKEVQNYRYVWPRDAGFICRALDILEVKGYQERFFDWLIERAEGLFDSGLLFQNYYPNGRKRWLGFQPDQNATIIWEIYHHFNGKIPKKYLDLVKLLSDGICRVWHNQNFTIISQDLWEERYCYPETKDTHTYSIAACCRALMIAYEVIGDKRYLDVSKEMKKRIDDSFLNGYFYRTFGDLPDKIVDASMIGISYPFEIFDAKDERMKKTIKMIEKKIVFDFGVYRYENDMYDSYRTNGIDARRGAGYWPILNFWIAIYYSKAGDKKKAMNYLDKVLKDIKGNYLPEQIFSNNIQKSVSPLAWSHAMFILASKELGLI